MKIEVSSFLRPPLPGWFYQKVISKYKDGIKVRHWANKAFYSTRSIKKTMSYIQEMIDKNPDGIIVTKVWKGKVRNDTDI